MIEFPGNRQLGFNVIGHISGNLGVGVVARNVISSLIRKQVPICFYDIDPGLGRGNFESRFESSTVKSPDDLPHSVNLFVIDPTTLAYFFAYENQTLILRENTLNAVLTFWELGMLPPALKTTLGLCDLVVTESDFIRYTIDSSVSNVFTISSNHCLDLPNDIYPDREKFRLPKDRTVFISSFEPNSDPERKNPFAVIEAFKRAFPDASRAFLLFKLNNAFVDGRMHPVVEQIKNQCDGHPAIRLTTDSFSYADVLSLYASADVFVSLHRAEGLGLGLMEAMALGKPVIATAWSGNMSFMNHTNACLVGYQLIPVQGSIDAYKSSHYGGESYWADPDVDQAAQWMRRLVSESALRSRIGDKAATDMSRYQEKAREATFVDEIRAIWESKNFKPRDPTAKKEEIQRLRKLLVPPEPNLLRRTRKSVKNALDRHLLWRFNKPTGGATPNR